jgi:hypothetical protein
MEGSSDKIHYHVMGISGNDPLSFDCHLPGGCIANLRIPDGTLGSTITYLKENAGFQNEKKVTVKGPVTWDNAIGAFKCEGLSLCPR